MNTHNKILPTGSLIGCAAHFTRSDLMELEGHLAASLRELLLFTSHSLYFPTTQNMPTEVQWISRERTLLLPLRYKEQDLGVFMARGVSAKTVHRLMRSFPAILNICIEQLACIKQSQIDEWTGLARMSGLFKRMNQQADFVRTQAFDPSHESDVGLHGAYKVCMGLLVLRCPALDSLAQEFGHSFAHAALATWAQTIQAHLPSEAIAARSGHNECTILLPSATRTLCQGLAQEIMTHIENLTLVHEASKRSIRLHAVAGFALYPQDMESRRFTLPMEEQSQYMLDKARLATDVAYECSTSLSQEEKVKPSNRVLGFGRVLVQGGLIRQVLSLEHVVTNLGRHMGAKEGQRFTVWGRRQGALEYKGELVLVDVRKAHSVAEVLHFADAAWLWEVGDCLRFTELRLEHGTEHGEQVTHGASASRPRLLYEQNAALSVAEGVVQEASSVAAGEEAQAGEAPYLLSHGAFLQGFAKQCEGHDAFALVLVRLQGEATAHARESITWLIELCHKKHIIPRDVNDTLKSCQHTPLVSGRYGETSLIFFHEGLELAELETLYTGLAEDAARAECPIVVGIAHYPYLDYAKTDALDCCHKALELAMLLPSPHVALMGSLALNISADQRYSRGDVFGAIEEYKRALLADEKNAMARNSLGVCMASLARHAEARQHFKQALTLWKKQTLTEAQREEFVATLYNLGTVCQKLDETRAAAAYFRQCIQEDGEYFYAYVRLGQLAEKSARYGQARQYYAKAAELEHMHKNHSGSAHRHLARVALAQKKESEARELLHEALLRNPGDAAALSMLAEIYLHAGEDPQMSEMLLRKSLGLRPEHANTWHLLAQCLQKQGQHNAALDAQERAAHL